MSMSAHRWLSIALLALAVVSGLGLMLQRQTAAVLQQEISLLREENRRFVQLKADNDRLRQEQTPVADVERLRADRAALMSMRAEIEAMKTRADKRSR